MRKEKTDEYLHYNLLIDATTHLQEHLFYSEFGGQLDYSDPWMALYNGLSELMHKLHEEKEMSEMITQQNEGN